ncbi:hypothetical protein Syun_005455 [Stephania yunnanensis]|uniref:Uncharacterized protein n=1 Tax=Stephania yunnanensis TaxID=152371 RepID=A0AAP0L690_9MAGN
MAKSLQRLLHEDRLRSSENVFNLKNEPFPAGNSYPTNPLHYNEKLDLFHDHFNEFVKCSSPSYCSDEELLSSIEDISPLPILLNHERQQPNQTSLSYFLSTPHDGSNVLNHPRRARDNGISYNCPICVSEYHTRCVTMPLSILHKSHPHLLNLVQFSPDPNSYINGASPMNSDWLYRCHACQFDLHLGSAIATSPATPSRSGITTRKDHAIARASNLTTPLRGEDMTPPSPRGTPSGATAKVVTQNASIIRAPSPSPAESPQIMRQPSPYYVRQASSNNASSPGIPEFGNSYANCIVASGVVFSQASQAASSPASQSHLDFLQGSPKDAKRVVVITTGEVMTGETSKLGNGLANQNIDGAEMPKSRCCCWLKCLLMCHVGQPH